MHFKRNSTATFLLALFGLVANVGATNYYVRTSGDDDSGGTSAAAACATISRAALLASNGDTIYVGAGVYTDAAYVLGKKSTSTLRIVADLTGSHTGDSGQVVIYGTPLRVAGSNNVELKDFTFQGMAAYPVIWENSYDGLIEDCTFVGGAKAVLLKAGSLTLDGCQLDDFQYDALQVDGSARLTVSNCTISDSLRHAILVRKNAITLIENTAITGGAGDGVHVNVTADYITLDSIPAPDCDCVGTSPLALRQQAYGILDGMTLADPVYQQIVTSAATKLNDSMSGSLWSDDWHIGISSSNTVFDKTSDAIEEVFAVLSEDVEFIIQNGQIVVSHPFVADVQVIGAAITAGGTYDCPVTVKVKVGNSEFQPFGSFDSPTQGTVNDSNNPRIFESTETFDPAEVIAVAGRSWLKVNSGYSGDVDSHWSSLMTVDSSSNSPYVVALRDGDVMPDFSGYNGQASAEAFLQPYVDGDDLITLNSNQVIFLFELGTTNLTSTAADFQDLVVIVTMARPVTPLTQAEKDQLTAALSLIMEATERMTNCAIDEATIGGGTSSDLATAELNYNNAVSEAAAAQYGAAATTWQAAWTAAKASTGNVEPDIDGVMAQLTSAAPPVGWSSIASGEVELNLCQVTGNENGVYLETDQAFDASSSDFSSNRTWGLNLRGTCSLSSVTVNSNQYGGVMLAGLTESDVSASYVTVTNNTDYAVFFSNCNYLLSGTDFANWTISGSKYVLAGEGGDLTLDNVSVAGGTTAGVYFYQGTLTAQNSTFSTNGYGIAADETVLNVTQSSLSQNTVGIYTNNNSTMNLVSSNIYNNSTNGVTINSPNAKATLTSCQIYSNDSGISLVDATNGDFELVQTVVRDNAQHGLYFENCTLSIADQSTNLWQTLRNGSGITANGSTLALTGIHIQASVNFGAYCTNSDMTLTDCTVEGATGVYLASDNLGFSAHSALLSGTGSSGGWALSQHGGTATLKNCLAKGFESGMQLNGGISTVLNATLVGSTESGILVDGANATVQNTLLVGTSGQQGVTRSSGQLTHSYNLIHGFTTPFSGTTAHDSEVLKKPRFADEANGDYHLAVGSPAINAGTDLSAQLVTDKDGNGRPTHGAFEIGAFEYVNSQGSFRVLGWQEQE